MAFLTVRKLILSLCVTACFITSLTRYNINIAIVDMTNTWEPDVGLQSSEVINGATDDETTHIEDDGHSPVVTKRYYWDQNMQGTILGSLFWTYMLFQIPSGVFVEWFGSRWIVALTIFASGIINMITPLITDFTVPFIMSRLLLGMFQAGCFPACFALLVKWMPVYERAFAFSLLRVGAIIGSVLISVMSGFLCEKLGWPFVFYVPGVMSLVVVIIFAALTRDNPADHPWITEKELLFIKSGQAEGGRETTTTSMTSSSDITINKSGCTVTCSSSNGSSNNSSNNDISTKRRRKIPWRRIFTSPAVLSYGIFKFALFWVNFTLSAKLPTYLNDEKGMDIGSNGVTNSLFNLSYGISLSLTGYLSDRVIEHQFLSRTTTRKVFSLITGFGSASCILFVPFVDQIFMMHFLLYFGAFCMGASSGGDVPLPSDMSQKYPATIFSLINMISMISGFTAPSFAGFILTSYPASTAWPIIFTSASLAMASATVVFLIFASADRQPFDLDGDDDDDDDVLNQMKDSSDSLKKIIA